jgi:hypothetical protein
MMCLWHALREDRAGHTWHRLDELQGVLKTAIGSASPNLDRAVRLGVRSNWLTIRKDSAGTFWIAESKKAENESVIAESVAEILAGPQVLPLFTEARPGECDRTDDDVSDLLDQGNEALGIRPNPQALAAIGRRLGVCQFCGRTLMKGESKKRGYGPICARKYGLPWGEEAEANIESFEIAKAPEFSFSFDLDTDGFAGEFEHCEQTGQLVLQAVGSIGSVTEDDI